jgi:esterase
MASMLSPPLLSSVARRSIVVGRRCQSTLHYESIGQGGDDSDSNIIFLHGLLGHGRNLKTFAKQVCAANGNAQGYLVDLPGHGQSRLTSTDAPGPHSFETCVERIATTLDSLPNNNKKPTTLVGHSWGGRMALQYAATNKGEESSIERVWLLDTVPGQVNDSVEQVIEAVAALSRPQEPMFSDKKQLVQELTETYQLDMGTAQWLASSYNIGDGDFGFDLDVVQDILPEFATQDFHGMLEELLERQTIRLDLVRGGKNAGWTIPILRQLESLQSKHPTNFHLHVLPKAGHWVHVDDAKGLVGLFGKP